MELVQGKARGVATHHDVCAYFQCAWLRRAPVLVCTGQYADGAGVTQLQRLKYEPESADVVGIASVQVTASREDEKGTRCIAITRGGHITAGHLDGSVSVWDPEYIQRDLFTSRSHHANAVHSIATSVADAHPELASGSKDGLVKLWDLRSPARAIATFSQRCGKKSADAWAVRFMNKDLLAVGYEDGNVVIVDLRMGETLFAEEISESKGICSLDVNGDVEGEGGTLLASQVNGDISMLSFTGSTVRRTSLRAFDGTAWGVSYRPGRPHEFVATGSSIVSLYQMDGDANARVVSSYQVSFGPATSCCWSPRAEGFHAISCFSGVTHIGYFG